jgi:hypothetical protein
MSNLKKALIALKSVQENLELIDEAGVDLDRIIAISNAQGPQAKLIKDILAHPEPISSSTSAVVYARKSLPSKRKKTS